MRTLSSLILLLSLLLPMAANAAGSYGVPESVSRIEV